MDSKKPLEVRVLFLDISKPFDKVWHGGLIFKKRENGISGNLLKLFQNYLSNRKQRVVFDGFSFDYSSIDSGVPQGSVLGPLLFLIYINFLEKYIKSNVTFFADETMLLSVVNNPAISANELNHDLKVINQWAYQWKMKFNPDLNKQATELLFSCKNNSSNHPTLFFNESVVLKVKEQKHLGQTLDSKLSSERPVRLIKILESLNIFRNSDPLNS